MHDKNRENSTASIPEKVRPRRVLGFLDSLSRCKIGLVELATTGQIHTGRVLVATILPRDRLFFALRFRLLEISRNGQ